MINTLDAQHTHSMDIEMLWCCTGFYCISFSFCNMNWEYPFQCAISRNSLMFSVWFFFSLPRLLFLDSILFFRMIVLVGYCCHCCHWHCHYGVCTINPHPRRLSRMRCVCTFFRRNEMKWAWAWASMARILCWSFVRVQWHQVNWRLQLHCVYMRE